MLKHLQSRLTYRLLAYTIPVALLLGFLVYQAFFMVVADSESKLARSFAEQKVLYYNDKTQRIILREQDIVQRLSASPELIAWAMDENNLSLKHRAINLLEKHRAALRDRSYFMAIDQSGHFYFNDSKNSYAGKELRYTLSPDIAKDSWYYATKHGKQRCQINVDPDRALNVTKVWINCQMRHGDKVVGIMGTGIDLSDFIQTAVKSDQVGVSNLYINQQGMIQAASDVSRIDFSSLTHHDAHSRKNILSLFDRAQDRQAISHFLQQRQQNHPNITTIMTMIDGRRFVVSMKCLKEIGWINVTMVDLNQQHIVKYFLPIALLLGLGMVLMFALLVFFLHRLVLCRLRGLDKNIKQMKSGDDIHCDHDATPDEIGRLTACFIDMAATVQQNTETLEHQVEERTATLEQSKQQMQAEHEQWNAVINHAMDGIIHINTRGVIQSFNPAAETMFGYSATEVTGQNIAMLMPEPDCSQHDGYLQHYLKTHEPRIIGHEREVLAKHKNGGLFPMTLSVNTMQLQGEEHFIGIVRDITDRKLAEELVLFSRQEAVTANRRKSEFLANMSHEIRTPMNAIIGMTQLTMQSDLTPKQQGYLSKANSAAHALLGIINDILDFSKIEAGKMRLEHVAFNLQEVLDGLAVMTDDQAANKGLKIYFSLDDDVPHKLMGDPLRLGQVLWNISHNAIKFTDHGAITLRIRTIASSKLAVGQVMVECSVQDSGIGVSEEKINQIFQPFTQADGSTTRTHGGTGLGLAISKQLVESMGGNIWVESVLGEGSRFIFTAVFDLPDLAAQSARFCTAKAMQGTRVRVDEQAAASLAELQPQQQCNDDINPILSELSGLIEENSIDADRCFQRLKAQLHHPSVDQQMRQLEYAINSFDFDGAKVIMLQIKKQWRAE